MIQDQTRIIKGTDESILGKDFSFGLFEWSLIIDPHLDLSKRTHP